MYPPPLFVGGVDAANEGWLDGVEFGHVGIYSIIDEFIYPIP